MLQLRDTGVQPNAQTALLFLILFSISVFYLFILAVQSWYYNLFGAYVENCEERLFDSQKLETLAAFTERVREAITPLHFGFSFARSAFQLLGIAILGLIVYIATFSLVFRNRNKLAFPVISALSGDTGRREPKQQTKSG